MEAISGRTADRVVRVSTLDQNEKRQLEGQVLDRACRFATYSMVAGSNAILVRATM
ncbi:hypothetical protein SB659_07060 [Arthrobacter sp. SIMBA_036]|uniref:hypothetical protein n=1 Tax=Arthrobacter sp. SIMBA_036 TaxID=3085778 RepID=UPI00397AC31E